MENPTNETEAKQIQLNGEKKPKGGIITMPFIIGIVTFSKSSDYHFSLISEYLYYIVNYYGEANEAFEKVASYGLLPNMIMYLIRDYRFGVAKGTNVLFMWSAATNFTPLLGAFLSDSYLGRFLTIAIASLSSFLVIFSLFSFFFLARFTKPVYLNHSRWILRRLFNSFGFYAEIRRCNLVFNKPELKFPTSLRIELNKKKKYIYIKVPV